MAFYYSSQGITAVASSTPRWALGFLPLFKGARLSARFRRICLQSAIEKNGPKCPECQRLIRKEPGAVHELLWRMARRYFPEEVEARRQALRRHKTQQEGIAVNRHQWNQNGVN